MANPKIRACFGQKQGKIKEIGFPTPQIHRLKSRLVGEVKQFQKKLLTNLKSASKCALSGSALDTSDEPSGR